MHRIYLPGEYNTMDQALRCYHVGTITTIIESGITGLNAQYFTFSDTPYSNLSECSTGAPAMISDEDSAEPTCGHGNEAEAICAGEMNNVKGPHH